MATKSSTQADIQKSLAGLNYPANKQQVISYAKSKNASGDVVSALNGLPDREFTNSTDISSELEEE